jgi:hypothetical protein
MLLDAPGKMGGGPALGAISKRAGAEAGQQAIPNISHVKINLIFN